MDKDIQEPSDGLKKEWTALLIRAQSKEDQMNSVRFRFSKLTNEDDEKFKLDSEQFYRDFTAHGPCSEHVELAEGLQLLKDNTEKIKELKGRKDNIVKAQRLFNMPMSTYVGLNKVEEEMNFIGAV